MASNTRITRNTKQSECLDSSSTGDRCLEISDQSDLANIEIDQSPEGIMNMLLSIQRVTKSTNSIVADMANRMDLLEERVSTIEDASTKSSNEIKSEISQVMSSLSILEKAHKLTSARLQVSENKQKVLTNELSQLKAHSMKRNIIFNIDAASLEMAREVQGENCVGIIKHFLSQKMGVANANSVSITVAHRIGKYRPSRVRPILAQFPIACELDLVMRHCNRLKGTKHFVTRQLPSEMQERNQFVYPAFKAAKASNDKARLFNGHLYVNGKEQTQFLPANMPITPDPTNDEDDVIAVSRSLIKHDDGNTFSGFASPVSSLDDISKVRQHLLITVPELATANHLVMAYRFAAPHNGKLDENFDSDGDHGMGLELLRSMRTIDTMNCVLFAMISYQPGKQLGHEKRADNIKHVCAQAFKNN